MRHARPSPPRHNWPGTASAQVDSDADDQDAYDGTAHGRPSPASGAAPAHLPWLSQGAQHEHYAWRDGAGPPASSFQDSPQGRMMQQAHSAAQQAHLGQFLEGPLNAQPPPRLGSGPRHHSMPDRRLSNDSASGLMHAAHDLMFGPEGTTRPRMIGMRSITLPCGVYGGRHGPNSPDPPMTSMHPVYPAGMPGGPHHPVPHHVSRPYHPGGPQWQPDFSVVRSLPHT